MAMDTIRIRGARTHNLKNVDLDLPRDKLIVIPNCEGFRIDRDEARAITEARAVAEAFPQEILNLPPRPHQQQERGPQPWQQDVAF